MRIFRGILALGTLALFVVVPPMSFGASTSEVHAQEDDPTVVAEAFFDEVNAGDVEGALALLADTFVFTDIDGGSFMAVGKPAFGSVLGDVTEGNIDIVIIENTGSGATATGEVEFSDATSDEAGVDRYVQFFSISINDAGLITHADFTYDEDDPETQEYLEFINQPNDEEPPPDSTITMNAQSGTNQTGEAFLVDEDGITFVGIFVEPGAEGVLQPAHLHTGTCEAPGPILQPLAWVLDGASFTILSPFAMPLANQGLILNVHKSEAEMGVYTSCGVIQPIFVDPTPTAPAPPAPTPTAGTGVVAPDTGSGPDSSESVPSWLFGLVIAGAVVAAGGALTLATRRS